MAKDWQGRTFNENWEPIDAMGNILGPKDNAANADYASKTGTQNPYTNQAGSSPWDTSGAIPGNEPGSTMPKGPAAGGFLDTAKIQEWANKLIAPTATNASWRTMPFPATTPSFSASGGASGGATPSGTSGTSGASDTSSAPPTDPGVYTDVAQATQGLTNVYRQFLGRDPGPGDVESWLNGSYGHGSGLQDYDKYVAAIMNSAEARAYRPATNTNPTQGPGGQPYRSLEWWQQNGVPTIDIMDPTTGQLRPGWARTANGYERTGAAAGSAPGGPAGGPQDGNYQSWFGGLTAGKPSSPSTLLAMESTLAQHGIKLQKDSAGNVRGRLFLPNGHTVDVVSQWGQPWTWIDRGAGQGDGMSGSSGGGGGGGSMTTPGLNVQVPGTQYSDPYTKLLEQMLAGRIGELNAPVNDPSRNQYATGMQGYADALGKAEPAYTQLLSYLQKRFGELQGPGYTGAENEVLRTQALDPIESDRAAAKKRVMERLSARGLDPNSGIAQQALILVDNQFDAMRGQNQTQLAANDIARREDRQQRAATVGGQLVDIPMARQAQQLDVFGALHALSESVRAEEDARRREAITYSGALSDLGPQRLQLAMQAAGMGGSIDSMFTNLLNVANLNQRGAALNNQRGASFWNGLGSIAYMLSNAGK